jgi:U3 small nucleolar RNA-associated protein 20
LTCVPLLLHCRWRELNTTSHWLDVERVVRPLTQSLPLLLLHKRAVLQALLQGLVPAASGSLPPLFALLVAAARDLQEEMVPLLPEVWAR